MVHKEVMSRVSAVARVRPFFMPLFTEVRGTSILGPKIRINIQLSGCLCGELPRTLLSRSSPNGSSPKSHAGSRLAPSRASIGPGYPSFAGVSRPRHEEEHGDRRTSPRHRHGERGGLGRGARELLLYRG